MEDGRSYKILTPPFQGAASLPLAGVLSLPLAPHVQVDILQRPHHHQDELKEGDPVCRRHHQPQRLEILPLCYARGHSGDH